MCACGGGGGGEGEVVREVEGGFRTTFRMFCKLMLIMSKVRCTAHSPLGWCHLTWPRYTVFGGALLVVRKSLLRPEGVNSILS